MEIFNDDFEKSTAPKKQLWKKVEKELKKAGFSSRSDVDCSVKWKNLKRHFFKLCRENTDSDKEENDWPYMESMTRVLKDNPTVTLENVTEVLDYSVKKKVTQFLT
ncbi:hypothetical protein DAPPUDRAFT_343800 [Daphnia pulex]|uniref:Myb/SANT-like DNA-binding domain-containing protein n=1 Tax=Daphnia pulex TaxID=6669 RepID=E9I6E7_DAPPU|nr:hypothetical protein DAPPUDRAFT_343800 [Daphnia pulex]|eukprot:EFX60433.1 hypothetical protein DAPPUDRAFT_343800 [Daphnia pulex]